MTAQANTDLIYELEAPGDLLSGLLAVSEAAVLAQGAGRVRDLPGVSGAWRILAPKSGSVRLTRTDRAWTLARGQAAAVPGSESVSLFSPEDGELLLLTLRGTAADRVLQACRAEGGLFFERGGIAVERTFRLLDAPSGRTVGAKAASEHAYQLLLSLAGTGSAGPEQGRTFPLVVEAALGILRREYAFLDGIGELADRLEVSQEYLTRCFCREIGVTPGKYLNQVRVENAKRLLRQGGRSIRFVSEACGFSNSNYFARVFRASVGMNPRDYARAESAALTDETAEDASLYVF